MQGVKIRLRDSSPANVWINPNWLTPDNELYFDTDSDFNLILSKEITKLTDVNQITVETVVDTSIPATQKNLAILGISIDVQVIDNTYPDHDIDLIIDHSVMPHNKLRVTEYSKEDNRLEVQILTDDTHWIEGIKKIRLNTLDLGSFHFADGNVLTNWADKAKYIDGEEGYYMGHVYYGAYTNKANGTYVLSPSDLRPLVHALKVLQVGFCEAGWKFSCPILETDTGRRLVTYVNSENYGSNESDLEQLKFKAVIEGTTRTKFKGIEYLVTKLGKAGNDQKLKFNTEIIDNGGSHDVSTGIFSRAGIFDVKVDFSFDATFGGAGAFGGEGVVRFRLVREFFDGTIQILEDGHEIRTKSNTIINGQRLVMVAQDVTLYPGDKIYVQFYIGGNNVGSVLVRNGGVFECIPKKRIIQAGDTINIGENLRDDTILDYLKGICHLFQLMAYTDYSANTVYFLTPFDLDYYGDTVSGYFNSSLNDLKSVMIERSEKFQHIEKILKNRRYSFKKSTDALIKSYNWNEYEPYSRFIDNGADVKDNEVNDNFENPYFEPTFSKDTGLDPHGGILEAPWMVDNLNRNPSFNIEPRILIAAGMQTLYYKKGKTVYAATYRRFQGDNGQYEIGHVFQKCNQGIEITGTYPDFELVPDQRKIVYGHYDDDLFELIHKKYDLYIRDNPTLNIGVQWDSEDYMSEAFRERALIHSPNIHDGDVMGRITKINSYDARTGIAELEVIADKQAMDECLAFEVPLSCLNYPFITYSKVGLVYTFSYAGDIASTIDTVTWEYRAVGATGWTAGNIVTAPTKNTEVLMTMTFTNGCPPIKKIHLIVVQLKPEITVTKVGNLVEAQETGIHEISVSDTTIYWSEDGVNYKLYEVGIDVSKSTATNLYFKAVVTYSTGDQREVDTVVLTDPEEGECPNPDLFAYPPSVVISKTPQSYFFYRTGEFNGLAAYDQIQYREKGKNQEWSVYDNEIISLQKCWEARRVLIWCDTGCLPYCSPVVESDCGACVTTSTLTITPSSAVCTHEQKFENPDVPASATWKVEPIDNSIHHIPSVRTWIEQNAGSPIEINELTAIWYRWNFRTEYVLTWNVGQTITSIEVTEAIGLVAGTQHTLDVNVEYESGATNDELNQAVYGAVQSALSALGFVEGENYILYVNVAGSGTKTLNLGFVAKHNPTGTWIGANNGADEMVTSTGNVTASGKEFQLETTSAPIVNNHSPYGTNFKLRLRVSTVDYFLNDASSNFFQMVANASSPILTDTLSASLSDTGKKYSLSGAISSCPGTTLWQWLYGGVKKSENGPVISRTNTATVFIQANTEIILIATCQSTGYCTYEKRSMLTI